MASLSVVQLESNSNTNIDDNNNGDNDNNDKNAIAAASIAQFMTASHHTTPEETPENIQVFNALSVSISIRNMAFATILYPETVSDFIPFSR